MFMKSLFFKQTPPYKKRGLSNVVQNEIVLRACLKNAIIYKMENPEKRAFLNPPVSNIGSKELLFGSYCKKTQGVSIGLIPPKSVTKKIPNQIIHKHLLGA